MEIIAIKIRKIILITLNKTEENFKIMQVLILLLYYYIILINHFCKSQNTSEKC